MCVCVCSGVCGCRGRKCDALKILLNNDVVGVSVCVCVQRLYRMHMAHIWLKNGVLVDHLHVGLLESVPLVCVVLYL